MAIPAKKVVHINLKAVEILNPRSETRFFHNTVEEPKANAARNAYKAALFERDISKIEFHRVPYAIIYHENIASTAKIQKRSESFSFNSNAARLMANTGWSF